MWLFVRCLHCFCSMHILFSVIYIIVIPPISHWLKPMKINLKLSFNINLCYTQKDHYSYRCLGFIIRLGQPMGDA